MWWAMVAHSQQQKLLIQWNSSQWGPLKVKQGSNAGKAIIFHWANTYGTCLEQI